MRFSDEYKENVLKQNFEDAKALLFHHLIDVHFAHLIMLQRVGIVAAKDAAVLASGLKEVTFETVSQTEFDGSFEDLFCHVEALLEQRCGAETAGKLHTARSRNDIDVTIYRLKWREEIVQIQAAALDLRRVLLEICEREKKSIIPMFTHTQVAQPSTIAHYFCGVVEQLERDHIRLLSALKTMNCCPLGSCAITGTGFPIDRHLTSELLAFDGPTGNTHASIAGVDYLLEAISALQIMQACLGRVLQDLLLWSTTGIQFIRLDDGFVQPSSIMPQKRNPVSLEHSRAILSRGFGQASAVFQMLHNTPFGDIVDIEDDLQPLVNRTFQDTLKPIQVLSAALRSASFRPDALNHHPDLKWMTLTELADTLVRREELPFRTAHQITTKVVEIHSGNPGMSLSEALRRASRECTGHPLEYSDEEIESILDPFSFVSVRKTLGGPAPEVIQEASSRARERIVADQETVERNQLRFRTFRPRLFAEAERLASNSSLKANPSLLDSK